MATFVKKNKTKQHHALQLKVDVDKILYQKNIWEAGTPKRHKYYKNCLIIDFHIACEVWSMQAP